ncbi:methylglyoxal synthase [Colwellia sp. MEBiC06753]
MQFKTIQSNKTKSIALVAHDNMKASLIKWCQLYRDKLCQHTLYATGTTGQLIRKQTGLEINTLISGPLGGDQQIGALITEQKIDVLIFFWDPLEAQPHDPDVKALLRLAAVWNIPVACNNASADLLITSSLFDRPFERTVPDYDNYIASRASN